MQGRKIAMGSESDIIVPDPYNLPIETLDVTDPVIFHRNVHWDYFKRLRDEDPIHFCPDSRYGPYWSITRYQDILDVDSNHKIFSSRGITNLDEDLMKGDDDDTIVIGGFIAMDPPDHDTRRKVVTPAVAPSNIARLENLIRERTQKVLRELPIGEEFDWVEAVSLHLTLLMLATLMDFPVEDQQRLKRWSDVISGSPGDGNIESWEQRDRELEEMSQVFLELREKRSLEAGGGDLVSMIVHSPMGSKMSPIEFISDISLLIVGGNDTTRNSMSGSIVAFNRFPEEWDKLMANPLLVQSAVPEIIRYQTPVMYQGRRATEDFEIGGKVIRKGDKVAMWYVSGNRDERAIKNPERFIIDRERPRQHLAFGFGVHRCLGNRLAEMQIRVLWEEIVNMGWSRIELMGEPQYAMSNMLRGIDRMVVRIHA
jgi:cytochrome P450